MTASLRKGWCPGALRPMPAKDGLLVRLRLTGGILTVARARALADLSERCGNGLFDLSARGNLQMRGVHDAALGRLQDGLAALGLLDASTEAEAVRNVIASPLAGLHHGLDIRPLVAALEARLAGDAALHALPAKFGVLVDDGHWPSLADIDADVRFDWTGEAFEIGVGGTRASARQAGICGPDEVTDRAAEVALAFLAIARRNPEVRRMRDAVDAMPEASGSLPSPSRGRKNDGPGTIVGQCFLPNGLVVTGLAAPFGRLDARMLRSAADAARHDLRLTPWRALLLPGSAETHVPGFISDPADPRLSVAACVGAAGCARATTDVPADAASLASEVHGSGIALHVSGCAKGCAKASPTPLTLVAREGRYDIVRDGRAGDPPWRKDLDLAAARAALRASA